MQLEKGENGNEYLLAVKKVKRHENSGKEKLPSALRL
jgi:hypothetical protein